MNTRELVNEQLPIKELKRRQNLGMDAAQNPLMAVEKQAWVDEYQGRFERIAKKRRTGDSLASLVARYSCNKLLAEMDILEDKFAWRKREADDVVDSYPTLKLTHPVDHSLVKEGVLWSLDLQAATIGVGDEKAHEVVQFATFKPVPQGLDQQYYGHKLIVDFELLAIHPDRNWVLR